MRTAPFLNMRVIRMMMIRKY